MDDLEYRWDFGDGNEKVTSGPDVDHDYSFGGKYTVELTVIDSDGAKSVYSEEISVEGISIQIVISLVVSIIIILVVIGIVVWRRLKEKMVREDKGLLDVLGLSRTFGDEETPKVERPSRTAIPGDRGHDRDGSVPMSRERRRIPRRREPDALPPKPKGPSRGEID
jgi:hypothetical protein